MTAVCGGGPSQARPGLIGNAFSTASGITAFLSGFLPLPVAIAIGAVAAVETFDVAQFCTIDPPADPGLTAQDMVDFMNPSALNTYLPALQKVRTWWRHVYWWQVCECSTVPTPTMPAPSNPGNQSQNPGLPSGSTQNCYETKAGYLATGVSSGTTVADLTAAFLPSSADTISVSLNLEGHTIPMRAVRIPSGVSAVFAQSQNGGAASPAGVNAHDGSIHAWGATGNDLGSLAQIFNSQNALVGTAAQGAPLPTGAQYISLGVFNTADVSVSGKEMSWSSDIRYICGTQLATPCCPPDPALEFKLNQLFQLVLNLQGQAAASPPTGWTDGIRHSGLEKAGSFHLAPGAIGVRFETSSIPPGFQVSPGDPNFYWDLGFITPFALGSPMRGWRLLYNPHSFHLPDFTDQIGYTLASGVVSAAVELLPTKN